MQAVAEAVPWPVLVSLTTTVRPWTKPVRRITAGAAAGVISMLRSPSGVPVDPSRPSSSSTRCPPPTLCATPIAGGQPIISGSNRTSRPTADDVTRRQRAKTSVVDRKAITDLATGQGGNVAAKIGTSAHLCEGITACRGLFRSVES